MSQSQNEERFVSIKELARRSSLSRTTLHNLVRRGDLPKPIQITPARVAWPESVIEAWFASKLSQPAA